MTDNTGLGQGVEETTLGHVQCHCSEDDGIPDVGVSIGLGEGSALWIGEILSRDGGDIGIVFHGADHARVVGPMWPDCEWAEIADIFRHRVAPILSRLDPTPASDRIAALEEGFRRGIKAAAKMAGDHRAPSPVTQCAYDEAASDIASAIRSLSPDVGEG